MLGSTPNTYTKAWVDGLNPSRGTTYKITMNKDMNQFAMSRSLVKSSTKFLWIKYGVYSSTVRITDCGSVDVVSTTTKHPYGSRF